MTYKATNGQHDIFKNFNSLLDAENYFDSIGLLPTYVVTLASTEEQLPVTTSTYADRLEPRIHFGERLVRMFLIDNAEIAYTRSLPITQSEADGLLAKLAKSMSLAKIGALENLLQELSLIQTDLLFTNIRKQKYILEVQTFLVNEL